MSDTKPLKLIKVIETGELFIRLTPAKNLFRSSLIHEVVNRGDVFVMSFPEGKLTILPGITPVTFETVSFSFAQAEHTETVKRFKQELEDFRSLLGT